MKTLEANTRKKPRPGQKNPLARKVVPNYDQDEAFGLAGRANE